MTETSGDSSAGGVAPGRRLSGRTVVTGIAVGALALGGAALGLSITNANGTTTPTGEGCGASTPRLTVQGSGTATGTPDLLTAVLQVNVTASSATNALNEDNTDVAAAVFALTKNGVAKKDIETTNLSLQPNFIYPKGVQTINGYAVSNTVTASLHNTKTAGASIDAVVNASGNTVQISSLTFSFNNPAAVEDKARADAVRQAVSHARAIAKASGHRLGLLCSITDQTQNTEPVYPQGNLALGAVPTAAGATSVPIESGTQSETDQVKVVYAIAQS